MHHGFDCHERLQKAPHFDYALLQHRLQPATCTFQDFCVAPLPFRGPSAKGSLDFVAYGRTFLLVGVNRTPPCWGVPDSKNKQTNKQCSTGSSLTKAGRLVCGDGSEADSRGEVQAAYIHVAFGVAQ